MEVPSKRVRDLSGQKFGEWKVLSFAGLTKKYHALWNCICSCGKKSVLHSSYLLYGATSESSCHPCAYRRLEGKSNLRPYESLYNWLIKQASRTARDCTITYSQFLQFTKIKHCHYCGDAILWAEFNINKNGSAYYLDRRESAKGYTKENCVVCCSMCNAMKRDFEYKEFLSKVRKICRRAPWKS